MQKKSKHKYCQLRIIGGQFRGRKINFPNIEGLRPTPDRVRETLFNWLAPYIHGANCLDCFAGSGALSFEAISRGAEQVIAIDANQAVIQSLKNTAAALQLENIEIIQQQCPSPLPLEKKSIDIVFLDPPFKQDLIETCCQWLEESGYLKPDALIYIESEKELSPLPIPVNWRILKSKAAGAVGYYLVQYVI